jgi:homogentisate 1,2-dioxygenase
LHAPTGWQSLTGPLRPYALDTGVVEQPADDLAVTLLDNAEVRIAAWQPPRRTEWFLRDADGDTCYFVHAGTGTLGTEYGPLTYREGDFLVVPRGTTHRFDTDSDTRLLCVTALEGALGLPDRGLLGRHALFDPAMLTVPEPEPHDETGEFEVRVRRAGATTTLVYPFHPSTTSARSHRSGITCRRRRTRRSWARDSSSRRSRRARSKPIPACCACPSITATSTTTR